MAGTPAHFPQKLGPYELLRLLATGGMAEVYLARRDGPHGFTKTVALKRILPQLACDSDFVSMFIDEARVCAQLSHPNLVQVFDFGEAGSELYMAMEFVDGTTGAKVVRKAAAMGEYLLLDGTLHIVLSVLRGLEYAHSAVDMNGVPLGLVHRDVSPGNILIARTGAVKLGDFGIARADDFERRTEEGQLKGKLGYMSPEQVTGRKVDARSDLFTLGIVLAELLVSRPLFGVGNELDVLMRIRDADLSVFERFSQHVHRDLAAIVRKALAQDPDDRFQTAGEFAEAIEEFARQQRISIGSTRLVPWLQHTGLITTTRSGEHVLDVARMPDAIRNPMRRGKTPNPDAIVAPEVRIQELPQPQHDGTPAPGSPPAPSGAPVSPAVFRVTIGDQVIGPIPYAELVELVATERATGSTPVARGNGPFRPARELPELARLLLSPALSMPPPAAAEDREVWEIDRASHAMKLFDLATRKETGLLVATQNRRRKKVFLVDGAPVLTTSTDKNELLGQQLIARGMALPMEIDMALALCPRYGGRLGDALVGLGVLRPIELFRALVAQTHDRFIELVSWKFGTTEFIRGVRAEGDAILHGTSPYELIAKGLLQGLAEIDLVELLAPFLDAEVRPASAPPFQPAHLRLSHRLATILSSIDSPRRMADIVDQHTSVGFASRDEVLRALMVGLSARLLITTGFPPPVHKPSVPTTPM